MANTNKSSIGGKTFIMFPGAFKPPHIGHFGLVECFSKNSNVNEIDIFISNKSRMLDNRYNNLYLKSKTELNKLLTLNNVPNVNSKAEAIKIIKDVLLSKQKSINVNTAYSVWEKYLESCGSECKKVKLHKCYSSSPIYCAYTFTLKNVKSNDSVILIKSMKDESNKRFSMFDKLKTRGINVSEVVLDQLHGANSTDMRQAILDNNKSKFNKFLPKILSRKDKLLIWKMVK